MARNKEFDDALDELKMLHDAKNHDYATAENPYKNLEGVSRIGIEPWRGIVIRLMDKFERVQQYCVNGKFAVKGEGLADTFKDISIYSELALILLRKEEKKKRGRVSPFEEISADNNSKGKEFDLPKIDPPEWDLPEHPSLFAVDNKSNGSDIYKTALAQKEIAQRTIDEEIFLQDRDNRSGL